MNSLATIYGPLSAGRQFFQVISLYAATILLYGLLCGIKYQLVCYYRCTCVTGRGHIYNITIIVVVIISATGVVAMDDST